MNNLFARLALSAALLSACTGQADNQQELIATHSPIQSDAPSGVLSNPVHGAETGLAVGALEGAEGFLANGAAVAHYFADNASIISIELNIAAAEKPEVYVAWVENKTSKSVEKLGALKHQSRDVRHALRFDTSKNLQGYAAVIITKQSNENSESMGQIVATGTLKKTARTMVEK